MIDMKWKACNSCRCALMRREAPQNQWIKRHYSRVIETASSPFSRKFHSQAGLALEGYSEEGGLSHWRPENYGKIGEHGGKRQETTSCSDAHKDSFSSCDKTSGARKSRSASPTDLKVISMGSGLENLAWVILAFTKFILGLFQDAL